jgi:O-antigen/teichoic acid export membrane protein
MSLRKQATSLAVLHAADILQPLLILPYAAKVLGLVPFGHYAYAMSIGQLAAVIVEYGFHWTAQRAAASARQEPAVIASIFAEVVATKVMLFIVVTLAGLAATGSLLEISKPMFLCVLLTSAGGILFPAWLFIALERVWRAAIAVVIARSLALVCFVTMVTSPDQLELAVAIQSAIPIVAGAVSLPFVVRVGFGGFKSVTPSRVGMQLRNGLRGFLFTLVETTLMILPVPLVAHFAGFAAAGQYSVAEKFVSVTRPFFRVVLETYLPRVAYYSRHDPAAGIALIWNSLWTLVFGSALSLFLFFLAPYFIIPLFGQGFSDAIPIVRVMSVIPVLMNVNICTSNLYMFNYGHERAWATLTVLGLLIFLVVAFLLSLLLSNAAIAVAVAVIARQCLVLVVSAGFFLAFSAARTRVSSTRSVGDPRANSIAATSTLASIIYPAPPWRNQPRSDR